MATIAAVCATVGFGFSTGSPVTDLSFDDGDEDDEFELLLVLNLLLRLHAATIKTNAMIKGTCFIRSPIVAESKSKRLLLQWDATVNLLCQKPDREGGPASLAYARASDTSPDVVS